MTAVEAAVRLARGAANSVKLVEHCLPRIAARDCALLATFITITKSSMFTKSSRLLGDHCTAADRSKVYTPPYSGRLQ